jgi:hypothetical protein
MWRVQLCLVVAAAAAAAAAEAGVASDVKYIKCEVCEHLVNALHAQVAALRKKADGLGEGKIDALIESVCKPEEEAGAWLRMIDLVEMSGGQFLRIVRQREDGPCGQECATVAMACSALLEEGWENELGEALYSAKKSAEQLREKACRSLSSSCSRAASELPKSRSRGPPFRAYTEEERAARGAPAAPGMLSRDELRYQLGLSGQAEPVPKPEPPRPGLGAALEALEHAAAFDLPFEPRSPAKRPASWVQGEK